MIDKEISILFYVKDINESVRFYREIMQFRFDGWWSDELHTYLEKWEAKDPPLFCRLTGGPVRLALHSLRAPDAPRQPIDISDRGTEFHVRVNDVDQVLHSIKSRGYEALANASGPDEHPWNWRTVTFRDPDGRHWDVYQEIGKSTTAT
jgi:catechol 2,3-dioxygenase-like lactoylglutathione lyase family enzyme